MGAGVGISMNADYRVATERTVWAMPECAIGLVPDVGTTHMLPQLPGGMGWYLGLTGARVQGADCLTAEVASHIVPSSELASLRAGLLALSLHDEPLAEIGEAIRAHHVARPGDLVEQVRDIDQFFQNVVSVEALLEHLRLDGGGFGKTALNMMRPASPTSLRLTQRLLAEAPATFNDCIKREFRVAANLMASHDFHEGVRALLVDKDRNPQWSPARLSEVSNDQIAAYFDVPLGGDLDLSVG